MSNETPAEVLAPCPFCGNTAQFHPYKRDGLELKCATPGCCSFKQRVLRQSIEWLRAAMTKTWNSRSLAAGKVADRDAGGRVVREAWVRWALTQPNPKPSWLAPYDELSEPDKEADRQIFEAVVRESAPPADPAKASEPDLHAHLLDMLGVKTHEEAGAEIGRLHGIAFAKASGSAPDGWTVRWQKEDDDSLLLISHPEHGGVGVFKGDETPRVTTGPMLYELAKDLMTATPPASAPTGCELAAEAVAYHNAVGALECLSAAFTAMDQNDTELEEWPQRAIDALACAGWAVVPCDLPYAVLGEAGMIGAFETGNPKHGWDLLVSKTRIGPHGEPTPASAPEVTEEMVERALKAYWCSAGGMRAALTAALQEGKSHG